MKRIVFAASAVLSLVAATATAQNDIKRIGIYSDEGPNGRGRCRLAARCRDYRLLRADHSRSLRALCAEVSGRACPAGRPHLVRNRRCTHPSCVGCLCGGVRSRCGRERPHVVVCRLGDRVRPRAAQSHEHRRADARGCRQAARGGYILAAAPPCRSDYGRGRRDVFGAGVAVCAG